MSWAVPSLAGVGVEAPELDAAVFAAVGVPASVTGVGTGTDAVAGAEGRSGGAPMESPTTGGCGPAFFFFAGGDTVA